MRRARRTGQRGGDSGATLVLVALMTTSLFATAAIVIGLGNARQTRREAQNIVDAAALAAAAELDGDFGDVNGDPVFVGGNGDADHQAAEDRADEYVDQNNLAGRGSVSVAFSNPNNAECIEVTVTGIGAEVWFGGIVGQDVLDVTAFAQGCRATFIEGGPGEIANGPDVPAVHTAGACGSNEAFDTPGNENRFVGDIYANDNPKDGGTGNHVIDGTARYRGNVMENNGLWTTPPAEQLGGDPTTAGWPAAFDPTSELAISLYASGGGRAQAYGQGLSGESVTPFWTSTSQKTWSSATPAGVYFITGSGAVAIDDGFSVTPRSGWLRVDPITGLPSPTGTPTVESATGITFVTDAGLVTVSDDGLDIETFSWELNRLAIYANWTDVSGADQCKKPSIEFSGACIHVNGIVYTPRGSVNIGSGEGTGNDHNGSSCGHTHPDFSGGFIGYGFKANGNKGLYRSGPGTITTNPGGPGEAGRLYLGG